jgi:hypothetical protein
LFSFHNKIKESASFSDDLVDPHHPDLHLWMLQIFWSLLIASVFTPVIIDAWVISIKEVVLQVMIIEE